MGNSQKPKIKKKIPTRSVHMLTVMAVQVQNHGCLYNHTGKKTEIWCSKLGTGTEILT